MATDIGVEVPEELASKIYQLVEKIKSEGKLKKGSNEVTKAIERGEAKLVIAASDVEPKEIIMHLPILCKEKETPFALVSKKEELGASAGLPVSTTAIAVVNVGGAKATFDSVVKNISTLSKASEKPKEEKKPEEKAEKPEKEKSEEKVEKKDKPALETSNTTPAKPNQEASKAEQSEDPKEKQDKETKPAKESKKPSKK